MKNVLWIALAGLVLLAPAALAAGSAVENAPAPAIAPGCNGAACTCNCYWSTDCADDQKCGGYGDCTQSGKLDGTCRAKTVSPVPQEPEPRTNSAVAVAEALNLYFDAYMVPVVAGTGSGDELTLLRARGVRVSDRNDEAAHEALQDIVNSALDATLGFDFVAPQRRVACAYGAFLAEGPVPRGNIRIVPEGAVEFVDATREGLLLALMMKDPSAIEGPLNSFRAAYPEYEPFHTGRYYRHGHGEESQFEDMVALQTNALKGIAETLISLAP